MGRELDNAARVVSALSRAFGGRRKQEIGELHIHSRPPKRACTALSSASRPDQNGGFEGSAFER
jgi:hypothetical protein